VGCKLASKGIDTRQAADAKAGDPAAKIGANGPADSSFAGGSDELVIAVSAEGT
jgi:hypothetical protein